MFRHLLPAAVLAELAQEVRHELLALLTDLLHEEETIGERVRMCEHIGRVLKFVYFTVS